ncbi:hypothetical protein like AT2G46940 [Hibiscus trionum]|uniref:Fold protein n=1 Tax=Hibiscus trionum TaxID=183268 RepID=A0A9W7IRQ0_HIBTR|nr:hypothetical protein like AT2G46940 [Hibiscus trionum]
MASDESMTLVSSMVEDDYGDIDVGFHQVHQHNLSRLSMCTSSMFTDEADHDDHLGFYMSGLSIESFDADVDEQFRGKELLQLSSDSDKEPSCYSLPATPPRRRSRKGVLTEQSTGAAKDYASENEAQKGRFRRSKGNRDMRKKKDGELIRGYSNNSGSFSGDSEGNSAAGLVVITRPKGGRRPLCMDMEEVKACRDLGFELEHERMLEMPSSGGNSPIAGWRISSPGDDPRDVKARLKVWAQAVALVSTSKHCS